MTDNPLKPVLGIDTSCDDTSASVVAGGWHIMSNIVSSQAAIHDKYGGIVPELASRRHVEMIWPVVDEALKEAALKMEDLSGIAVCHGPGLIGSLLVGTSFAKAISYAKGIPLVGVNHLEGHISSLFLLDRRPTFPFLCLIVSGGHTSIVKVMDFGSYRELGRTRDDAAGEAYDKVAKLLGLGYPGGPLIDSLASEGDPRSIPFPRAMLPGTHDFSFSGLKTAVRNHVASLSATPLGEVLVRDICASFQAAVVEVLVKKLEGALVREGVKRLALTGGVAANRGLRKAMKEMAAQRGVELFIPPPALCTDNAAMIAAAGHFLLRKGVTSGLDLNPTAYLPLPREDC